MDESHWAAALRSAQSPQQRHTELLRPSPGECARESARPLESALVGPYIGPSENSAALPANTPPALSPGDPARLPFAPKSERPRQTGAGRSAARSTEPAFLW